MRKNWTTKNGDMRELTVEMMQQMRLLREIDPEFIARFEREKKLRGRPAGRKKKVVSISLDNEVLDSLRASGEGWQTRVNDLLRAAVGLNPPA